MDPDLAFTPFKDGQCWWKDMSVQEFLSRARLPEDITKAFAMFHQPTKPVNTLIPIIKQFLCNMVEELSLPPSLFPIMMLLFGPSSEPLADPVLAEEAFDAIEQTAVTLIEGRNYSRLFGRSIRGGFVEGDLPDPNGSAEAVTKLFSVGRPLWGAYLDSGSTIEALVEMVKDKLLAPTLTASKDSQLLALLCMRADHYVSQQALAEHMTSNSFRFDIPLTGQGNVPVTVQPGEPLLAYVSSRLLMNPQNRLDALRSWEACLAAGSVISRDVGEQIVIMILMFSFDNAFCPQIHLPMPLPLESFWDSVFGSGAALRICRQDIATAPIVFFNHFVHVSEAPSLDIIKKAFTHGAGLLMPAQSKTIHALIPFRGIYGPGAILIQVESRYECKLTSKLKQDTRAAINEEIDRLGIRNSLSGGYIGIVIYLRRAHGSIRYTFSPRYSTSRLTDSKTFPIAYALGLDVFQWNKGWPNEGDLFSVLNRILNTWSHTYPQHALEHPYVQQLVYPFSPVEGQAEEEAMEA
ncbi:unnamed protein product [Parascedosporium putredinis]|uniref:Uncharacterized protein n=1 Tax=Parascedosporium putredinis TaxID=1442378 RepID=A0A9P1H2K9_9PEZI|nr:unnamed protein product [Parascedosporium putredinis]CAI7993678.1 unnamed protein product [Parascedosporium putredinis]